MKINLKNQDEFEAHVLSVYPQEAVGIVLDEIFIPLENVAEDPVNTFKIENSELDKYRDDLEERGYVIHSHTFQVTVHTMQTDPRAPSMEDMLCQEALQIPFGIVHTEGKTVSSILWFGHDEIPEFLDRPYISNVQDCFTLARDYYKLKFNIEFGVHPRPIDWIDWNPHYIEHHFKDLGLYEVSKDDIKEHDILLFAIAGRFANHIGIVVGDNRFIHHLLNRQSCEDEINRWNRQLIKVLRHREVI